MDATIYELTASTDAALTAQEYDGRVVVADADGGIWWPDDSAQAEIDASKSPAAEAVRICNDSPMRGEWRQ